MLTTFPTHLPIQPCSCGIEQLLPLITYPPPLSHRLRNLMKVASFLKEKNDLSKTSTCKQEPSSTAPNALQIRTRGYRIGRGLQHGCQVRCIAEWLSPIAMRILVAFLGADCMAAPHRHDSSVPSFVPLSDAYNALG